MGHASARRPYEWWEVRGPAPRAIIGVQWPTERAVTRLRHSNFRLTLGPTIRSRRDFCQKSGIDRAESAKSPRKG